MAEVVSVNFPDIGEGVVEGEVIQWLKKVNDPVKEHEPVVIVMTDKATVELPSPYEGKIVKHHYQEGEMAIHDHPLYDVELAQGSKAQSQEIAPAPVSSLKASVSTQELPQKIPLESLKKSSDSSKAIPKPLSENGQKALASPPTRKLAKDLGIDIQLLKGTGPEGRVTKEDLIRDRSAISLAISSHHVSGRAAPNIQSSTPVLHWDDDEEFPLRGLRNYIAEKMVESKFIIPHFSYFDQMDATRLTQMREKIKMKAAQEGYSLSFMPLFIRALSLSIFQYPIFNGSVDLADNTLIIHKHQNIGIAFKTPAGLVVPVLKNVQEMSLTEIIKAYHRLKEKASQGKLEPADMRESTITISNFGPLGGLWATPIINYPEVAILGVAKIHKEPAVVNDEVVVRDKLNLSWSFDHRIIDGDAAAEFSNYFIHLLKNPAGLL